MPGLPSLIWFQQEGRCDPRFPHHGVSYMQLTCVAFTGLRSQGQPILSLILVTLSIFKSLVLKHWTNFEETRLEGLSLQSRRRATCRSSRAHRGERLGCSHGRLDLGLPCRGRPALTSALLPGDLTPSTASHGAGAQGQPDLPVVHAGALSKATVRQGMPGRKECYQIHLFKKIVLGLPWWCSG